jgi:hypothetical protein
MQNPARKFLAALQLDRISKVLRTGLSPRALGTGNPGVHHSARTTRHGGTHRGRTGYRRSAFCIWQRRQFEQRLDAEIKLTLSLQASHLLIVHDNVQERSVDL